MKMDIASVQKNVTAVADRWSADLGRLGRRALDLTTDARPDQIKPILKGWADATWTQGERFGTIGAKKQDRSFEITTHRAEAYTPDSRKPSVEFSDAIEADLSPPAHGAASRRTPSARYGS